MSGHGNRRCQGQEVRKSLSVQGHAVWLEKKVCVRVGRELENSSGSKPWEQAQ